MSDKPYFSQHIVYETLEEIFSKDPVTIMSGLETLSLEMLRQLITGWNEDSIEVMMSQWIRLAICKLSNDLCQ